MSTIENKTWYSEFFQGASLDLWRRAVPPEITEQEVEFLQEVLELPEGGRLLDAPSGNGRLNIPLALLSYQITAIDISPEFSAENKSLAKQYEVEIDCICGDMKDLNLKNTFDGAICMGNSFGYFDRSECYQFISKVSDSLKQGSRFVIDTEMLAESFLVNGGEKEWVEVNGIYMLVENQYDCKESSVSSKYIFLKDGKQEQRMAKHYIYTSGELCHMLSSAGMQAIELWDSLEGDPYTLGSDRLIIVVEKS